MALIKHFSGFRGGVVSGITLFSLLGLVSEGSADVGQPVPWQVNLPPASTPVMSEIIKFHDAVLLPVIFGVSALVAILLLFVLLRFNHRIHPKPSRSSHNTFVEVIWTILPILVLVVVAIPSFRLLYLQRVIPEADLTVKAVGHQWYWSYEYPDQKDVTFDSLMVEDSDLVSGQPRLLAVDNEVIVPVGRVVRLIVTASDVIHSWTIPAFGIKIDAIPGRLNEGWFKAERTGIYYGQCSELCGARHAFMPIAVRVVEQKQFDFWSQTAQEKGVEVANAELKRKLRLSATLEASSQ